MLINGQPTTKVSASDRGLSYGDGLFETMVMVNDQIPLWQFHIQRLTEGCRRLNIKLPDVALLEQECQIVGRSAGHKSIVKIIITRGEGNRGYRPQNNDVNRIISATIWPTGASPVNRISLRWCQTRLSMNPSLSGIKHLNRLDQVLASSEWDDEYIAEGLMLDQQGHVIEGTKTNVFIIKDKCLFTPLLNDCGVKGIIRRLILNDDINHGLEVREQQLSITDIISADEIFVCNCVIGIWSVSRIIDNNSPASYTQNDLTHSIARLLHDYLQY